LETHRFSQGVYPNSDLIRLILKRDSQPTRYLPVGSKAGVLMPHALVEDLLANSEIEVMIAALAGLVARF